MSKYQNKSKESNILPPEPAKGTPRQQVVSASGSTSSHFSDFSFYASYEGARLTAIRFQLGNTVHENGTKVYSEMNWLKAFHARDIDFFRNRAGHALEHIIDEMHGIDDTDPGGNLGALGWFQDVMAYVKKHDPHFYGAIQGKWPLQPHTDRGEK